MGEGDCGRFSKAQKFPIRPAISFPTTFPRENGEIGEMAETRGKWGEMGESGEKWVAVVGLWDFHPHWYGLECGSDPSTPLLTTAQSWG